MKLVLKLCAIISIVTIFPCYANTSSDTAKIDLLFVDTSGSIAVTLTNDFSAAREQNQCPTANGFAGVTNADPAIKSALLAAKAADKNITIITRGCTAGGAWFNILALYVR